MSNEQWQLVSKRLGSSNPSLAKTFQKREEYLQFGHQKLERKAGKAGGTAMPELASSVWGKGVNFLAFHVPHMEPTRQCQVKPSNKECSIDVRSWYIPMHHKVCQFSMDSEVMRCHLQGETRWNNVKHKTQCLASSDEVVGFLEQQIAGGWGVTILQKSLDSWSSYLIFQDVGLSMYLCLLACPRPVYSMACITLEEVGSQKRHSTRHGTVWSCSNFFYN